MWRTGYLALRKTMEASVLTKFVISTFVRYFVSNTLKCDISAPVQSLSKMYAILFEKIVFFQKPKPLVKIGNIFDMNHWYFWLVLKKIKMQFTSANIRSRKVGNETIFFPISRNESFETRRVTFHVYAKASIYWKLTEMKQSWLLFNGTCIIPQRGWFKKLSFISCPNTGTCPSKDGIYGARKLESCISWPESTQHSW